MDELKIEYVELNNIKPYDKNARKHQKDDVSAIINSIKEFGFSDPIGVWGNDNIIVEGHGRLEAAKKIGLDKVPIIHLDHLSDEQRRAYALAHNKTAELSSWLDDVLSYELDNIFDIDMSEFGFALDDLDGLIEEEIKEDEAPEDVESVSKIGDLWRLGNHRLICGDSTDVNVIDRLMDGIKANLLLTDPPYGIDVVKGHKIGRDKAFGKVGGGNIVKSKTYSAIIGDDTTDTARASYDVALIYSDNQIIFGGNYFTDFLYPSRCWVVWDKENTGNFADAELAWTSFDKGVKLYHFLWNGLCREGSREIEGKTRVHPTQKPVGMLGDILKDFSSESDSILDLFGGSGSTLIACEQLNRKCYMCELDPRYIDVIIQRYINLKGSDEDVFLIQGDKEIPFKEVSTISKKRI